MENNFIDMDDLLDGLEESIQKLEINKEAKIATKITTSTNPPIRANYKDQDQNEVMSVVKHTVDFSNDDLIGFCGLPGQSSPIDDLKTSCSIESSGVEQLSLTVMESTVKNINETNLTFDLQPSCSEAFRDVAVKTTSTCSIVATSNDLEVLMVVKKIIDTICHLYDDFDSDKIIISPHQEEISGQTIPYKNIQTDVSLSNELELRNNEKITKDSHSSDIRSNSENNDHHQSKAQQELKKKVEKSVVESTHYLTATSSEFKLTESELQLGKKKPYWIPDEDCNSCMLCLARFTLVNRRHHCRACGRVLCRVCCSTRRILPYIGETEGKQRICEPCNKTLDRINEYEEKLKELSVESSNIPKSCNAEVPSTSGRNEGGEENRAAEKLNRSEYDQSVLARKKSLLKNSRVTAQSQDDDEIAAGNNLITSENDASSSSVDNALRQRRNVTFRDGVNPGSDVSPVTNSSENQKSVLQSRKNNRRTSHRTKEKRADEEYTLLYKVETSSSDYSIFLVNEKGEFLKQRVIEVLKKLRDGSSLTIAIRRNFHLIVQFTKYHDTYSSTELSVWFLTTSGFQAIGADEIVLLLEMNSEFDNGTEEFDSEQTRYILELLLQFDDIFTRSLVPLDSHYSPQHSLDDRMGIRRTISRMSRLYPIFSKTGTLVGISAAAICLHRLKGQNFGILPLPSSPFFIATLLKQEELPWAMANVSDRILFKLGLDSFYYPCPIVNFRKRNHVFSHDLINKSVLKLFNDFYSWAYRMQSVPASYATMTEHKIEVFIPCWAKEEIKSIVESNRNVVGWALDYFNEKIDGHLVCDESSSGLCETKIFTKREDYRKVTGGTFLIFDGALKQLDSRFSVSIVEDGFLVRLHNEVLEELVKSLAAGDDFNLKSSDFGEKAQELCIKFLSHEKFEGSILSPIDGLNLDGHYQYGLVMNRQFRSLNFFKNSTEWALRLTSVINMSPGKFPTSLQSKYFELSEQIATLIAPTIEPFLNELIFTNQRSFVIRINIDGDMVLYDTEQWLNLPEQHMAWTTYLDEQIVPFLYSICQWLTSGFYVELYLYIVSIRPLPSLTINE